jgi:hypothetical protein
MLIFSITAFAGELSDRLNGRWQKEDGLIFIFDMVKQEMSLLNRDGTPILENVLIKTIIEQPEINRIKIDNNTFKFLGNTEMKDDVDKKYNKLPPVAKQ